ncbi:hypothetical protein [Cytobacillus sp. FSL H8-0458]|uniref:hypothetical protein n=1 Tax=Cytobacillus sp. FSL H8-0458 TaxID=2975346 RepID=UPI0030FB33F4
MSLVELFKEAASLYGLPFALFIALLIWVLWKNDQREGRYLTVIQTLSEDVKERLSKIEARIFDGRDNN